MNSIYVTSAKYQGDYRVFLKFSDGEEGEVDLSNQLWGEVFEPLKNKDYFKNFKLNEWTIEWENGADFAPEALHQAVVERKYAAR